MSFSLNKARFSVLSLILLITFILVACGDSTATSTVPAAPTIAPPSTSTRATAVTTAIPTAAPTTVAATTVAPTTASTTNIPTTLAATTAAPATTAATTSVDPQKAEAGRKVFVTQCAGCHLGEGKSGGGIGPNLATSEKSLDAALVRSNVRNGKGQMVAFTPAEVSDADLENIIIYLKSIHK